MKKDFTQPFKTKPLRIYLFLEEYRSGKFYAEYDEDFYSLLSFTLQKKDDLTLKLTEYLYKNGFALNRYTELNRQCEVSYSFIDGTPGVSYETVCLHALVDRSYIAPTPKENIDSFKLEDLQEKLWDSPFGDPVIDVGIEMLIPYKEPA